jgi:uncharacterized membrane protein
LITIVTYFFAPSAYVRFGVLHLLALASIIAFPIARKPVYAMGIGIVLLLIPLSIRFLTDIQSLPVHSDK